MIWLLAILLASRTGNVADTVQVDLIELNHVEDQYDQVIYWTWDWTYRRYHCQGFVVLQGQMPVRRMGGKYELTILKLGRRIRIQSNLFTETWTKNDPERDNEKIFPKEYRRFR